MAKQSKGPGDGPGKIKFRVIEFEMDGSDTSLQESLKSLTAALRGHVVGGATQPRVRLERPANAGEDSDTEGDAEDVDATEVVDEEATGVPPRPSKRAAAPKKLPQVKFLSDLRTDQVSPTLREFATEKKPDSEIAKYLVIAYWFKHFGGLEEVTLDHFFTAYKHIGWQTPKDPTGPIRDARHKRRTQLEGGKAPGTVKLTYVGERAVEVGFDK